jgi:hypothetical protein
MSSRENKISSESTIRPAVLVAWRRLYSIWIYEIPKATVIGSVLAAQTSIGNTLGSSLIDDPEILS